MPVVVLVLAVFVVALMLDTSEIWILAQLITSPSCLSHPGCLP